MIAADDHTTGEGRPRLGGRRRTVARLAAVQALYQLELNPELDPDAVVREFARYVARLLEAAMPVTIQGAAR